MDKFKTRIRYYMIGLAFGTLLVYFMFGNRGCAWLPENRVKNMIGEKEIIVGDSVLAVMECLDLNNDHIYELLKDDGDVDFSMSITNEQPKIYYISGSLDEQEYNARFALYEIEGYAEVIEVSTEDEKQTDCAVTISNREKSTLSLPHRDVIQILEANEFRILAQAECEMEFYHLPEPIVMDFHKTATIDIARSEPRLIPNPFYVLNGDINGVRYSITYIVGENRTRISKIEGEQEANCETEQETSAENTPEEELEESAE